MLFHDRPSLRKSVPRADFQPYIASVNPVPNRGPELLRNRSLQLNSEVRNAAAGIQLERRRNRLRWACLDAARATAAAILFRLIRRQFESGDDLRNKEPITERPADQVGVFACEAESRALRQVTFQQRPGIDIPQALGSRTAKRIHELS